jgi:hypothetical protein
MKKSHLICGCLIFFALTDTIISCTKEQIPVTAPAPSPHPALPVLKPDNSGISTLKISTNNWLLQPDGQYVFDLSPDSNKLPYPLWDYFPDKISFSFADRTIEIYQGNFYYLDHVTWHFSGYKLYFQSNNASQPPILSVTLELSLN